MQVPAHGTDRQRVSESLSPSMSSILLLPLSTTAATLLLHFPSRFFSHLPSVCLHISCFLAHTHLVLSFSSFNPLCLSSLDIDLSIRHVVLVQGKGKYLESSRRWLAAASCHSFFLNFILLSSPKFELLFRKSLLPRNLCRHHFSLSWKYTKLVVFPDHHETQPSERWPRVNRFPPGIATCHPRSARLAQPTTTRRLWRIRPASIQCVWSRQESPSCLCPLQLWWLWTSANHLTNHLGIFLCSLE